MRKDSDSTVDNQGQVKLICSFGTKMGELIAYGLAKDDSLSCSNFLKTSLNPYDDFHNDCRYESSKNESNSPTLFLRNGDSYSKVNSYYEQNCRG